MTEEQSQKPAGGLREIRRKAVNVSPQRMVVSGLFKPEQTLPLITEPAFEGVDLLTWAEGNRELIDSQLTLHGAILFRNFDVTTAGTFSRFVESVSGKPFDYLERSTPRSRVEGNVYTSTEYPANQGIFLHNENSYAHVWPLRLAFCCVTPAQEGGETPIADTRKILRRIAPAVRGRFEREGVMYVRNFGHGLGLTWETVFQTMDGEALNDYCRRAGYEVEWRGEGRLRTRRVGPAVVMHPRTGTPVWFNHATFFHVSTLEPVIRAELLEQFKEEDLPHNTFYGDGTPIEPSVLDEMREAYRQETVSFKWQRGDVLLLDNMLTAHGRSPFVGPRKILAAMSNPFGIRDTASGDTTA